MQSRHIRKTYTIDDDMNQQLLSLCNYHEMCESELVRWLLTREYDRLAATLAPKVKIEVKNIEIKKHWLWKN